jgi:hypothetical protein
VTLALFFVLRHERKVSAPPPDAPPTIGGVKPWQ